MNKEIRILYLDFLVYGLSLHRDKTNNELYFTTTIYSGYKSTYSPNQFAVNNFMIEHNKLLFKYSTTI